MLFFSKQFSVFGVKKNNVFTEEVNKIASGADDGERT